ncbi:MAG: VOC family protein [Actinomycetes bacterium]
MSNETTIRPVPEGYGTVTPWMISKDTAGVLDFLARAFDAEELSRVDNPNGPGIGHAEVRIGDSVVMLFDALTPAWPYTPSFLRLYLPDGDRAWQQAVDAGATPLHRMTEMFWGDRVGRVRDPFGNVYWIQTRVLVPDADEVARRMVAPEFVEAMKYLQGGELLPPESAPESAPKSGRP